MLTRRLLNASSLFALATVTPGGRAYANTAYFAWTDEFDLIWLSDPDARHSRNLQASPTAAVSVYDSRQIWGERDRGIQLFGSARAVIGRAAREAESMYAKRFPAYSRDDLSGYRFYRFRPQRVKLFDERDLGRGVFVTARVRRGGSLIWERTEIYGPSS